MGRTRLGRFAAVTVPATIATAGLGFAMVQGLVTAQLSAAEPFQVKGSSTTGEGLELSLRAAETATSDTDDTATSNKSALVTLKDGVVNDLCLAANQATGLPLLPNIGLTINAAGATELGDVNLSADSISSSAATLPQTDIGVAQSQLDTQSGVTNGYREGGWGLESTGNVSLTAMDADVYALSLQGLTFGSGLTIAPTAGTASCS